MNFSIEERKENDLIIKAATGKIKTRTIRNLLFSLTLQSVRINSQGALLLIFAKSIYYIFVGLFVFGLGFPHTGMGVWKTKTLPYFTLWIVLNNVNDVFCYLLFGMSFFLGVFVFWVFGLRFPGLRFWHTRASWVIRTR